MKKVATVLFACALFFTVCLPPTMLLAQTSPPQTGDRYADKLRLFEEFLRRQMEKDKIPGLTIGFYKDDYTWVKGFGYADLENKTPATAESAYRLASITKTFTGVAILQLVEKGKMSLDGEIQTYLPYYPKQKWPVTVKQLLVHTGGGQQGSGLGPTYVSPKEVVERIAKFPIQIEPGTKYEYTTSGYNLLGAAIEEVTGMSFGDYLRHNIWGPLGMKDTRMDSVRDLIPNRGRGYELVNGEIKNIQHLDVSTRFGGGGATGTVPDLLRWAKSVDDGSVLSKQSVELMYTPATTKGGRYVGIGDGSLYYTLGWVLFPVNGQLVIENNGSQIGTNTELIRIPSKNLTLAFACNIQMIDRMVYLKRLYELLTDEPYDIRIYSRGKADQAIVTALTSVFNYGAIHFERTKQAFTTELQDLAKAFAYFNRVANRSTLAADYQVTEKAIEDGRHLVAGDAFIKVGSYIAMRLREKYGAGYNRKYSVTGAIPFFADYMALYKSDLKHPPELRFSEAFERMLARWDQDWARAWNDHTRHLRITADSDFDALGERLKESFTKAEVYPNFIDPLLANQDGIAALKAGKLTLRLYPESARANGNWGLFLLLMNQSDERRELFRKNIGELEQPLPYFKKSLELQPDGFAGPRILGQISRNWFEAGRLDDALALLDLAVELHPKEALFHTGLGQVYLRKGMKEKAAEACRKALALDPDFGPAQELIKKLAQ